MKEKSNIILLLVLITFSSCFKEDDMIEPHKAGNVNTSTIELGQYYKYQVYFDMGTGQSVANNEKDDWDLGFASADSCSNIILNTSKFMMAANTGLIDFQAVTDTSGLIWRFDKANGDPDSAAIGNWFNITMNDTTYPKNVYVIDGGLNELGVHLGYKKIIFEELKNGQYSFKFANLNGSEEYSFTVIKDPDVNFVSFSFKNGGKQVEIQPEKNSWDLLFTQYTDLLFTDDNEPYPYIVTGTLINRNGVEVAFDTLMKFSDITISDISTFNFSTDHNKIGYEWKIYDFDNSIYTVFSSYNYIIIDVEGFYYKLRFIGFYNNMGEKGYPTIEYQKL